MNALIPCSPKKHTWLKSTPSFHRLSLRLLKRLPRNVLESNLFVPSAIVAWMVLLSAQKITPRLRVLEPLAWSAVLLRPVSIEYVYLL